MDFKRRDSDKLSKLGKGRKKKQKWKRPTGRDNKMREKKKGKPQVVSIGFRRSDESRSLIKEKNPVLVNNVSDLLKIKEEDIGVVAGVGKKKKLEIARKANEKEIELYNMNPQKYLKLNEKPQKKANQSNK
ncbi:MAG: eL32 family ribosomal protein [Candidatus Pacearchaeota archaeon]